MNNYNIILAESAFDDLELILLTYKSKFGLSYALKTLQAILNSIYSLNIFPNSNPILAVVNNTVIRKRIVNKRYIIAFQIIEKIIFVHFIYDGRRNISPNDLFIIN